jgi:hypothetical protein
MHSKFQKSSNLLLHNLRAAGAELALLERSFKALLRLSRLYEGSIKALRGRARAPRALF